MVPLSPISSMGTLGLITSRSVIGTFGRRAALSRPMRAGLLPGRLNIILNTASFFGSRKAYLRLMETPLVGAKEGGTP